MKQIFAALLAVTFLTASGMTLAQDKKQDKKQEKAQVHKDAGKKADATEKKAKKKKEGC